MTKEESEAIKSGKTLGLSSVSLHGTYDDGTPFVREYPANIFLMQGDTFNLNLVVGYPDPFADAMKGRPH
jgi:hypothetical protein